MPDDVLGEWWLPHREEEKIHGILRFSAEGSARLELDGAFHGMADTMEWTEDEDGSRSGTATVDSSTKVGIYERILGESKREGKVFTLTDCASANTRGSAFNIAGRFALENIRVGRVVEGLLFLQDEEVQFDGCQVLMRHMTSWVAETGLTYKTTISRRDSGIYIEQTASWLPALKHQFTNGSVIELMQCLKPKGNQVQYVGIEQWFRLNWRFSQLMEPTDILDEVGYLQDLISIAANRPAEVSSIELLHPESKVRTLDGTIHEAREPVRYWYNSSRRDRSSDNLDIEPRDLYFTLSHIGGIDQVANWIEVARANRTALARVLSVVYGASDSYLEDKLMNCLVSLEHLDRQRRGKVDDEPDEDTYFRTRIDRNIALAGSPFAALIGDYSEEWKAVATSYRNGLAHHDERIFTRSSSMLYFMVQSSFWLFVLCMFRAASFDGMVFDHIERHHKFQFLGDQLRPILDEYRREIEAKPGPRRARVRKPRQQGSLDPRFQV